MSSLGPFERIFRLVNFSNLNPGASPMHVNIVHGTQAELVLFLVLNMWPSHLGLPLLLATVIFSKKVHRHPTFINLCIVFILVGMCADFLLVGK